MGVITPRAQWPLTQNQLPRRQTQWPATQEKPGRAAGTTSTIGAGIALEHLDVIKRSVPTEDDDLLGTMYGRA